MATTARAGPVQSHEPGASSWSLTRVQGPSVWAIFCFPRLHSRELDSKWSSWDPNRGPHGMPASQVAVLPAMPQPRPLESNN